MKAKEYCENCKKLITSKMKDKQQVIYSSAEHTLDSSDSFVSTDPMFNGPFCCQNCFNEIVGINLAHIKGFNEGMVEGMYKMRNLINQHIKPYGLKFNTTPKNKVDNFMKTGSWK